jgi:hypothetical protein
MEIVFPKVTKESCDIPVPDSVCMVNLCEPSQKMLKDPASYISLCARRSSDILQATSFVSLV